MPRKDEAPTVVSLFDELEESFIVIVVYFLPWRDIGFAGAFFAAIVSVDRNHVDYVHRAYSISIERAMLRHPVLTPDQPQPKHRQSIHCTLSPSLQPSLLTYLCQSPIITGQHRLHLRLTPFVRRAPTI